MKEETMNGVEFISLAAGEIVEESIMEDILLRLPIKSLIRFKSVCKTWRSLISNSHFERAHLSRQRTLLENTNSSSQKLLLIVGKPLEFALKSFNYEESSNFEEEVAQDLLDCPGRFSLPPSSSVVSIRIHGSCDGLVCLCYDSGNNNHTIVIWNPTTGEFKQIPAPTTTTTSSSSSPFWIVGFGHDPGSYDYKILAVCFGGGRGGGGEVMIFSLKKDKLWRSLGKCHEYTPSGGGVYLNGYFHWLAAPATNIWSFDLSDEKFKVNIPPLPKEIIDHDGVYYASLAVLGGCLFVYAGNCEVERSKCWIFKGGKLWRELSDQLKCYQGRECLKYAVGGTSDDKLVFHLFDDYKSYGREKHFLCLYSMHDNSSRLASFDNLVTPQMYVQSLVSPCRGNS